MTSKLQIDVELRLWAEEDLPLLMRLMGDSQMTEHMGGPETPEKILERHNRYLHLSENGDDRMFVILVGPKKTPAGSIGYWEREWQGEQVWETGWSVLPEFQGQGIATRATRLVVARVHAIGKHRFLHAYPSVENPPSNAICRKAGFTLRGLVDFEYPKGHMMRCNDWRVDLFSADPG